MSPERERDNGKDRQCLEGQDPSPQRLSPKFNKNLSCVMLCDVLCEKKCHGKGQREHNPDESGNCQWRRWVEVCTVRVQGRQHQGTSQYQQGPRTQDGLRTRCCEGKSDGTLNYAHSLSCLVIGFLGVPAAAAPPVRIVCGPLLPR